jgi:hypothetical protein
MIEVELAQFFFERDHNLIFKDSELVYTLNVSGLGQEFD